MCYVKSTTGVRKTLGRLRLFRSKVNCVQTFAVLLVSGGFLSIGLQSWHCIVQTKSQSPVHPQPTGFHVLITAEASAGIAGIH